MVKSKVIRWGNSLAIKLPKSVRELAGLGHGDELAIFVTDKSEVVINKLENIENVYDTYKIQGNIIE